jgi:phosphatidate phosphatase PAH1
VRFTVLGDGTTVSSWLWLLPAGTHVVVTDIDGTLTTSDTQLFQQLLDKNHVPEAYPGARDLTQAHAELGWIVVYLTGRPDFLTQVTRDWLRDLDFAPGPVHLARRAGDVLPTTSGVGAYKQRYLEELAGHGAVVDFAYGNATTDIDAYLGFGLAPADVWIIGPHAGERATNAIRDDWQPRIDEVDALPPVDQPFAY